jgi:nucleotide-binding universal stress UspA family protein
VFERILLAVDGSEHSKKAASAAGDLTPRSREEVHALYVHEEACSLPSNRPPRLVVRRGRRGGAASDGAETSEEAVAKRSGSVAPTILEAALLLRRRDRDGDEEPVGLHGPVAGSVAHKVTIMRTARV